MRTPKLSVIIPVYRIPERYLRSALESIMDQTMNDFEAIVIDDGAPEECGQICDEFAARDDRFVVCHTDNRGVSAARNTGLGMMHGRFLTFLDADDRLTSTAWGRVLEEMAETGAGCAIFGWETTGQEGRKKYRVGKKRRVVDAKRAQVQISGSDFACGGGYPWNKVWDLSKMADRSKLPLFPTGYATYEDKVWVLRMLNTIDEVVLMPDICYEYRVLADSLSRDAGRRETRKRESVLAYEDMMSACKERKNHWGYLSARRFYRRRMQDTAAHG